MPTPTTRATTWATGERATAERATAERATGEQPVGGPSAKEQPADGRVPAEHATRGGLVNRPPPPSRSMPSESVASGSPVSWPLGGKPPMDGSLPGIPVVMARVRGTAAGQASAEQSAGERFAVASGGSGALVKGALRNGALSSTLSSMPFVRGMS
ncbi:hypothetical protein GCM10009735_12990 [Actinomadura chokoriensis]